MTGKHRASPRSAVADVLPVERARLMLIAEGRTPADHHKHNGGTEQVDVSQLSSN